MPPGERPLESAKIDHVALSVGDLEAMVAFYAALGFDEVSRRDFAPAPIRLATVVNQRGARLELTANDRSEPTPAADPIAASRRRGPFHFALSVELLADAVQAAVSAGAGLVTQPAVDSRGEAQFAYIADPEGNLVELVGPLATGGDPSE
ncbi:VOC family protein [Amycolatopsis sp. NPDC024027]|uniref:VOC family protein n=1 Tax=Amycolatopsis sp. NPDC024027 TaxID=3154327 RepID=UPI0033D9A8BE